MVNEFEDKDVIGDIKNLGFYTAYIGIIIGLGFWSFTAGKAAEVQINFVKLTVFSIPMFAYLFWLWGFKVSKKFVPEFKNIVSYLHDPEYSVAPNFILFRKPLLLLAVSILLFSVLGIIGASTSQTSFGSLLYPLKAGVELQQVAPSAELLFNIFGAPAENAFLYIILAILITTELILANRVGFSKKLTYFVMIIPNSIISAFIWLKFHNLVVGGDEAQGFAHAVFGFNGALLTQLTGSIIPFEVYHIANNLFNAAKNIFGSDWLLVVFSIIVGVIIVSGLLVVVIRGLKKK